MTKKELPKPKKTLKSFILEEDAKIMDETATKIALTLSFLSITTVLNAEDAHAQGHSSHSSHENHIYKQEDYDLDTGYTGLLSNIRPMEHLREYLQNNGNETNTVTEKVPTKHGTIPAKLGATAHSVNAAHGNHYNHGSGSGQC